MEKEKKVGFFKSFGIAIAKPKQYYKIANNSVLKVIGMYFLISILCTIVLMGGLYLIFKNLLVMAKDYISNLPEFSISKNGFIAQMEKPIEYYDSISGVLVYIDSNITFEEIKSINIDKIYSSNQYFLMGNDAFSIKSTEDIIIMTYPELFEKREMNDSSNVYLQETDQKENEEIISGEENESKIDMEVFEANVSLDNESIEENELLPNVVNEDEQEFEFNNDTLNEVFVYIEDSNIYTYVFAIMSVVLFIFAFILFIIMGLIYSIVTLIICLIYKKKLSFKEIYNVSMYSNVTATILSILILFLNIPYWGIIRFFIMIFYMQSAIKNYSGIDDENIAKIEDDNNNVNF